MLPAGSISGPEGGLPVSAKHFQLLVVKALWDEGFRNLLFARPDEAMKDFDLTKDERAELQRNPQPDPPGRITLESLFRRRS